MPPESVFPLNNGEILSISGGVAGVIGTVESQAVLFNRDQGEQVTTGSVNERKTLSLEGVVTAGIVVDENGRLLSEPSIEVGASGFLRSTDWEREKPELIKAIIDTLNRFSRKETGKSTPFELPVARAAVRETMVKALRGRLQARPVVQVVMHELPTSRLQ